MKCLPLLAAFAAALLPAAAVAQSSDTYTIGCAGSSIRIAGFGYSTPAGSWCPITTIRGQSEARDYVAKHYLGGKCSCDGNGRVSTR